MDAKNFDKIQGTEHSPPLVPRDQVLRFFVEGLKIAMDNRYGPKEMELLMKEAGLTAIMEVYAKQFGIEL